MKPKKCRVCKSTFEQSRPMQVCCSPICAIEYAKKSRAKIEKQKSALESRKRRIALESLKTRSDILREAQQAFNAYIRARDRIAGHPCISSGRQLDWSGNNVDAGHYRSTGSAPHLRFDERNCHAQSKHDNRYLAGNAVEYRRGLIQRIGINAVEQIESDNTPRKWSKSDLIAIRDTYKAKLRELKR